jgi:hypothetical protein
MLISRAISHRKKCLENASSDSDSALNPLALGEQAFVMHWSVLSCKFVAACEDFLDP